MNILACSPDELAEARDQEGRVRRGPGRRPDGVLVRANAIEEAIEVELTPKRDRREYDRKLAWYAGQLRYGRAQWFVPSFTLRGLVCLTSMGNAGQVDSRVDDTLGRVVDSPVFPLWYPPEWMPG
jgi:hypothetical protein